jgi:hypothetical protein
MATPASSAGVSVGAAVNSNTSAPAAVGIPNASAASPAGAPANVSGLAAGTGQSSSANGSSAASATAVLPTIASIPTPSGAIRPVPAAANPSTTATVTPISTNASVPAAFSSAPAAAFSSAPSVAVPAPTTAQLPQSPKGTGQVPVTDAIKAAAWALLQSRFQANRERDLGKNLFQAAEDGSPESSLSPYILAGAPHLRKLFEVEVDPYLKETYRLRRIFETDKGRDEVVELLQRQKMQEPLPKSIWRDIVQDKVVSFDKINGTFDKGFDFAEAPKDVGGGYSLIKNENMLTKKSLRSESEWTRCFDAWATGVAIVYPHRGDELAGYRQIISEIFHKAPEDPGLAIQFDVEVRERYAKTPFRIDNRLEHNTSFLAQMVAAARSIGTLGKRRSSGEGSISKRPQLVCENWNMGRCEDTPCKGRRRHGVCSECGGYHRAADVGPCYAALKGRRQKVYAERDAAAAGRVGKD